MPFERRSGSWGGSAGVSVSTQANIPLSSKGYESEDETSGRNWQRATDERPANRTTMYSKQEFREQYCISSKQLDLLELENSKKDRFLGCLSQYNFESPCSRSNRSSFLSVCVRRRVPSDENLNANYAPLQRYSRTATPSPTPPELCAHDADLQSSYFRRRTRSVCGEPDDPKRYTWLPEDEDSDRMEWPQSVIVDDAGWPHSYNPDQIASVTKGGSLPRPPSLGICPKHPIPTPPPPPVPPAPPAPLTMTPQRPKHVSFARSHTMQTFDDSIMPGANCGTGLPERFRLNSERLVDGRSIKQPEQIAYPMMVPQYPQMTYYPPPVLMAPGVMYPPQIQMTPSHIRPALPEPPKILVLDKLKRGAMRTQATQTEVCLGRKPLPPHYLSLSPRTIKRVKMVAAGVQTNGIAIGPRRLTKSFSEVGRDRLAGVNQSEAYMKNDNNIDYDRLQRTQSEEPPHSPCSPNAPKRSPKFQRTESDDVTESSIKSVTSSQLDRFSEVSAIQRQAQEYFQQNFQFIHESDRDDTIDDDIDIIKKNMALNRRNLEYLQQEIAKQSTSDKYLRSALSKTTSDASQKTFNSSQPLSKTPTFQSEPSTETSATTTTDDSERNEKEIIIDFKPRLDGDEEIIFNAIKKHNRKLQKTLSEGEILLDVRKSDIQYCGAENIKDVPLIMSTSQENMSKEETNYREYIAQNYVQTPIKDEGIFGFEPDGSYSSSDGNAPYGDFHEKYISYKHDSFSIQRLSFEEQEECLESPRDIADNSTAKSSPGSQDEEEDSNALDHKLNQHSILKTEATLSPLHKASPCASVESLAVDQSKDHSDGNWNESQTTVLQVDSGTDNGTVVSSSDLSSLAASPGSLALLTPTSRRKQLLLLQHQQRSSLDTDALDEEFDASQNLSPITSPRNKLDTSIPTPYPRPSLSPPAAVVPNIPITKQPTSAKSPVIQHKYNHAPAIAITHPSLDLTDIPFKRTTSFINKKRERALSPSRRKDLQKNAHQKEPNGTIPSQVIETTLESSSTKMSYSDTNLARTDSGKTNTTDMSESTTTDDYVTANSDSSKKSGINQANNCTENKTQEGSSFESASSLYSCTKTENIIEEVVNISFSPPLPSEDIKISNPASVSKTSTSVTKSLDKVNTKNERKVANDFPIDNEKNTSEKIYDALPKELPKQVSPKDTVSVKSSSSGSYSVASNNNASDSAKNSTEREPAKFDKAVETRQIKPSIRSERRVPAMKGSLSDDEKSGHYSSSGYYESPADDDDDGGLTYKHSQKYRSSARSWLCEEKRRKKKALLLDFSKSYDDSISSTQDDWDKEKTEPITQKTDRGVLKTSNLKSPSGERSQEVTKKKKTHFADKPKSVQSSPKESVDVEKSFKERDAESKRPIERERHVKRTRLKAKSPTQIKADPLHGSYRTHLDRREGMGPFNMKLQLNIPTSDDSSEQYKKDAMMGNGNISPRKHRRLRESPRRKTTVNSNATKSPTSNNHTNYGCRPKKNNGSNESISLPGSLPRRKQSIPAVPVSSMEAEDIETTKTLTRAGSRLTPLRYIKSPNNSPRHQKKDGTNDKSKAASAESLRSVSPGSDSVFFSEQADNSAIIDDAEAKAHCLHCGKEVHIITASHEQDNKTSRTSHTDESFTDVSPEIVPAPARFADSPSCTSKRPANGGGARLYKKLEKRYRSDDKSRHYRNRHGVRAKSEERGKEEYASTEKQTDTRIARSAGNSLDKLVASNASEDIELEDASGSSEGDGSKEDRGVYAAPWWCGNWIFVSSNDDVWERIPPDSVPEQDRMEDPTDSEGEFNKRYVALTHRLVHRQACVQLIKRQCDDCFESDKTVFVQKGDEEFGFRIHGSKPVVVSAIEPDTPAETSGLEVGDIIIAVNGIHVLDKSHSEVVKIAHAGSEVLKLEVARTCEAVASLAHEGGPAALYAGYLWRAAPIRPHHQPRWTRRWFVLKKDNCLYYYKTDSSIHPVGALMLVNYQLSEEDAGRPHGFRLYRGGGTRLSMAADSTEAAARWRAVLAHAIDASNQRDGWLETTMRNMKVPPSSVPRPDCFGYLMKLGSQWKSWAKRYCVLKDACLYFYSDGNSKSAFGMACLHGYRVQNCFHGGKKYAFEVVPTEPKQRHFYFYTESEMDKKRWMAALEYSIDRWMKAG